MLVCCQSEYTPSMKADLIGILLFSISNFEQRVGPLLK